jgi:hypothetical protein
MFLTLDNDFPHADRGYKNLSGIELLQAAGEGPEGPPLMLVGQRILRRRRQRATSTNSGA